MSTLSIPVTAALVLLLSHLPATPSSSATPAAASPAQAQEIQQLKEHVANLDGQLKDLTSHMHEVVDVSVRSSLEYRDYVSIVGAVALVVAVSGG